MKLTPLDIRHKEFRRAVRGYSDEEVDVFLDEVADEFERLFQENIDARERIEQLEEHLAQYEGLKETLQQTLISAQQQAEEMKSNARKEAELILKDAGLKARDIVNESYQEKQSVQQSLTQLKQVEEDFRFKFRSLLEAHINLLSEDEGSEERRKFEGTVSEVEGEMEEEEVADLHFREETAAGPAPGTGPERGSSSEPSSPDPYSGVSSPESASETPADDMEEKEDEGAGEESDEGAGEEPDEDGGEEAGKEDIPWDEDTPAFLADRLEDDSKEEEEAFFKREEDRDFRW